MLGAHVQQGPDTVTASGWQLSQYCRSHGDSTHMHVQYRVGALVAQLCD
jgi:hypothetical protein